MRGPFCGKSTRQIASELDTESNYYCCQGRAAANSRRALKILAENQRLLTNPKPFPLLRLPLELRQQIYEEVLKGTNPTVVVKSFDISAFQDDQQNRDIETFYGNRASPHWENPVSTFQNATPNIYGKDITTGLLLACKSIYTEAIPILYQGRMFDFGVDVFGIVPFLRKMTPLARQNVQNIHMEFYDLPTLVHKRGTTTLLRHHWHVRGNTQDWTETCAYITNHLQLKNLSINVNMEVSKPTDPPVDLPRLKWVQDLVQIRELQQLSYHVSSHGHGLKDMGPRGAMRLRDAISVPSQLGSDAVDGDVKGAQPGLGKLFGYLRGEMLGMSTESGRGFETGA